MNQSTTVAIIVVAAFAGGFFVGRASAPSNASAPIAAAPSNSGAAPFPGAAAPSAPMARGPMMNAPMGNAPMAAPPMGAPSEANATPVAGKIQEIIQVPNFTYLRLDTGHGDEWAAIPTNNSLAKDQQVTIAHPLKMSGFTSKTLNRTFDSIWFGELGQ